MYRGNLEYTYIENLNMPPIYQEPSFSDRCSNKLLILLLLSFVNNENLSFAHGDSFVSFYRSFRSLCISSHPKSQIRARVLEAKLPLGGTNQS